MRTVLIALIGMTAATAAHAKCDGRTVTKTGPNGRTLELCLDGKYSTCLRDAQRLGWPYASAKRYCDGRPGLKK